MPTTREIDNLKINPVKLAEVKAGILDILAGYPNGMTRMPLFRLLNPHLLQKHPNNDGCLYTQMKYALEWLDTNGQLTSEITERGARQKGHPLTTYRLSSSQSTIVREKWIVPNPIARKQTEMNIRSIEPKRKIHPFPKCAYSPMQYICYILGGEPEHAPL